MTLPPSAEIRDAMLQALADGEARDTRDEIEPAVSSILGLSDVDRYAESGNGVSELMNTIDALTGSADRAYGYFERVGPRRYRLSQKGMLAAAGLGRSPAATGRAEQPTATGPEELGAALHTFMELFPVHRDVAFSGDHPAYKTLRSVAQIIGGLLPTTLRSAVVRDSVGRGNWASVPWVAVLEPKVTPTTQDGVYPVLLFAEDMSSVELTIAQGVTKLKSQHRQRDAHAELRRRAEALSPHFHDLVDRGFTLDNDFSLGTSVLARDYVASTVVHKAFNSAELVGSHISEDVEALLASYGSLVESGALAREPQQEPPREPQALIVYLGQTAVPNFEAEGRRGWWGWREAVDPSHQVVVGDLIAFGRGFDGGSPRVDANRWSSHALSSIVVGRITTEPHRTDEAVMPDEIAGAASYPWKIRFEIIGEEHSISLDSEGALGTDAAEAMRRSAINRGVGISVPVAGSPLLRRFAVRDVAHPSTPEEFAMAASAFVAAVAKSGVELPAPEVAAFFAAIAAKPLAILTGQSGSGKTQLAMRLGEWCGSDSRGRPRMLVVPVRPDWTGPEYLFGYPDILRSTP
jgi:5-methylcytosine-specific restriction enzyme MrcB-like protein